MRKTGLVLCQTFLILCMLFTMTQIAFGASGSVHITGEHSIDNPDIKTGQHTFVLTAKDGAPMPSDAVDGVKKVSISSGETFDFGEILLPNVGEFHYTVSREIIESENLKQDNSVYNVTVYNPADSDTAIILEKVGEEGKPDKIKYSDTYVEPTPVKKTEVKKTIKTGDTPEMLIYFTLMAATIFVAMKTKKHLK